MFTTEDYFEAKQTAPRVAGERSVAAAAAAAAAAAWAAAEEGEHGLAQSPVAACPARLLAPPSIGALSYYSSPPSSSLPATSSVSPFSSPSPLAAGLASPFSSPLTPPREAGLAGASSRLHLSCGGSACLQQFVPAGLQRQVEPQLQASSEGLRRGGSSGEASLWRPAAAAGLSICASAARFIQPHPHTSPPLRSVHGDQTPRAPHLSPHLPQPRGELEEVRSFPQAPLPQLAPGTEAAHCVQPLHVGASAARGRPSSHSISSSPSSVAAAHYHCPAWPPAATQGLGLAAPPTLVPLSAQLLAGATLAGAVPPPVGTAGRKEACLFNPALPDEATPPLGQGVLCQSIQHLINCDALHPADGFNASTAQAQTGPTQDGLQRQLQQLQQRQMALQGDIAALYQSLSALPVPPSPAPTEPRVGS